MVLRQCPPSTDMGKHKIKNLVDAVDPQDAATKAYIGHLQLKTAVQSLPIKHGLNHLAKFKTANTIVVED